MLTITAASLPPSAQPGSTGFCAIYTAIYNANEASPCMTQSCTLENRNLSTCEAVIGDFECAVQVSYKKAYSPQRKTCAEQDESQKPFP